METWRKVWREGLAPQLSTQALEVLRRGLINDDPRILQCSTTSPPPIESLADSPVEAACLLGYCGWQGQALFTVAEVEQYFAELCCGADNRLNEPIASRWFLNWYDEVSRNEMRRLLLPEVIRILAHRTAGNEKRPTGMDEIAAA